VNAIRNGQEETGDAPHGGAPALATDEHHMEQVNLSLKVHAVFHAQPLPQKSKSLQVFTVSSPTAWGNGEVFAKWIPHVLNDDQKVMGVFFLPPPISSIGQMKAMRSLITFI
jgi:hypothetical protein